MSDSAFRPGSDAEWEEVLRQLRQPSATQPGPFFYLRVRARLTPAPARPALSPWVRRVAYAVGLAALVAALSGDAAAITQVRQPGRPVPQAR